MNHTDTLNSQNHNSILAMLKNNHLCLLSNSLHNTHNPDTLLKIFHLFHWTKMKRIILALILLDRVCLLLIFLSFRQTKSKANNQQPILLFPHRQLYKNPILLQITFLMVFRSKLFLLHLLFHHLLGIILLWCWITFLQYLMKEWCPLVLFL